MELSLTSTFEVLFAEIEKDLLPKVSEDVPTWSVIVSLPLQACLVKQVIGIAATSCFAVIALGVTLTEPDFVVKLFAPPPAVSV